MDQSIVVAVEKKFQKAKAPEFRVGDTVDVHQKIVEGNRSRGLRGIQCQGVCWCSVGWPSDDLGLRILPSNYPDSCDE